MRLPSFNVVKSAFCTCLPKYNVNPYLGRCAHRCIYCYAVKFPSFRGPTVPRLKLREEIVKMAEGTKTRLPVMISDTTDPYQPLEKKHGITRRCLKVLAEHGFPLLIVTKSALVTRDIDIFKQTRTVVSITITTPRKEVAKVIEPGAPFPELRFSALKKVADEGIPTVVRVDPIIPTVNSDEKDLEALVHEAAEIGVKQITASTMKPVRGFFSSLRKDKPELFERLNKVYADGGWVSGYKYLSRDVRLRILKSLRAVALKHGLEFATCREGFPQLNTTVCDGTTYCRDLLNGFIG
ncbi:MAG: radical SAM protein [Candidatus Bathyarchaeota archaeon]|nr:radical SAM protein [Candidatus Bathyarchaeota archaeon]